MSAFGDTAAAVREGTVTARQGARALVDSMTLDERLWCLDGDIEFWPGMADMLRGGYYQHPYPAGVIDRLGIPGIVFTDGPRGVVVGAATAFPVSMARAATWEPALEERVGHAIAVEVRAVGANFYGGVCVNLLRHPAWGRAQETYGEDPVLLGEMGSALSRGVQSRGVMACVKHFALNSIENARFQVDVTCDEATLHEVHLPAFERIVRAGVASVMSAYNSVNGAWCGENKGLLLDILRDEWNFDGMVISDFIFGLRDAALSVRNGLDIENALPNDEHRALAREVAQRSIVLLRNEDSMLPIRHPHRVCVLGQLASVANLGDGGSSDVHPPAVVTPLDGLVAALPDAEFVDDPAAADVAIVVVGLTKRDEGEFVGTDTSNLGALFPPRTSAPTVGDPTPSRSTTDVAPHQPRADRLQRDEPAMARGGDRTTLELSPHDEALILSTVGANPRTVVVVMVGSAVVMERWRSRVPAIVLLWYPGIEGGHALADVLLGRVNPSGRLPFTIPADEAHLPDFDPDARAITYDRWLGYARLDRDGLLPAYPLGWGLSYTAFRHNEGTVSAMSVEADGETAIEVTVDVTNEGTVDGCDLVLAFVGRPDAPQWADRPIRRLGAFSRVDVPAGSIASVALRIPQRAFQRWEGGCGWVLDPGVYPIEVGRLHGDPAMQLTSVRW